VLRLRSITGPVDTTDGGAEASSRTGRLEGYERGWLIRSATSSGTTGRSRRCSATGSPPAGIDISPYALSHLAYRVVDRDVYLHLRTLLERHATANAENLWNGRPISLIVLAEPLDVLDGTPVSLIELIPPVHQRVCRMGLEHLGVVTSGP
jgi:hypothetical protein